MKEILESEIATVLPSMLHEVDRESIAIRSDGRPVAYLVSPREFETTREARGKQAIEALKALQTEVALNVEQHGLSVDDLMGDIDRKAR